MGDPIGIKVCVNSDGMAVLTLTLPGHGDPLVESRHTLVMHLSTATSLADQIYEAVRAFPGSPEDSPAWFEANQ